MPGILPGEGQIADLFLIFSFLYENDGKVDTGYPVSLENAAKKDNAVSPNLCFAAENDICQHNCLSEQRFSGGLPAFWPRPTIGTQCLPGRILLFCVKKSSSGIAGIHFTCFSGEKENQQRPVTRALL